MRFDRVMMVDWSGGNDRGPRPCRDAIWIAEAGLGAKPGLVESMPPVYCRNRGVAEAHIAARIADATAAGARLMVGFDFPFGYPQGVAAALTGGGVFDLWALFAREVEDAPKANNRFDLCGALNGRFPGSGPFWGNGLKRDIAGLPRTKAGYRNDFPDKRHCEARAKGSFSVWQLSGAGSVGSQVVMGLPVLERLRQRFDVAVWPFEALERQVVFTEVWPGLIASAVAEEEARSPSMIRDAVQVALLARGLMRLQPERMAAMLTVEDPVARREEGWILGLGYEDELGNACR